MAKKLYDLSQIDTRTKSASRRNPSKTAKTSINYGYPKAEPIHFKLGNIIRKADVYKAYGYGIHKSQTFRQKTIGIKPGEERAIPSYMVRGSLAERILYKELQDNYHLTPNLDFFLHNDPYINLGGSVVGIVFPLLKAVIVIMPSHTDTYSKIRKDAEHRMVIESRGFEVFELLEDDILDGMELDIQLDKFLGWSHSGGPDSTHDYEQQPTNEAFSISYLTQGIANLASLKDALNVP